MNSAVERAIDRFVADVESLPADARIEVVTALVTRLAATVTSAVGAADNPSDQPKFAGPSWTARIVERARLWWLRLQVG